MNYRRKLVIALACLTHSFTYNVHNWLRPYEILLHANRPTNHCYQVQIFHESGIRSAEGYNCNGHKTDVLSIWNKDQNVISMLQGFNPSSRISQLYESLDVSDDGIRGHVCPAGNIHLLYSGTLALATYFRHGFSLHLYVPWMVMRLQDVCWTDLTQSNSAQDIRLKEELTDNLGENIYQLSDGLHIGPWKRSGFGDTALVAQWMYDFIQNKPLLKNVQLRARLGITMPTGKERDEDRLFAMPFGYDGSAGVIYGGGLQLNVGYYCKLGFDVELLHLFGNTKDRRIKTDICQTELLLLAKTCAYKDLGLTQRFDLFAEFDQWLDHWSFLIGYQYFKHGDDRLSLISQEYSNAIANTAVYLQEWTMHHLIFKLDYRYVCAHDIDLSGGIYTRIPVKGERSALASIFGIRTEILF